MAAGRGFRAETKADFMRRIAKEKECLAAVTARPGRHGDYLVRLSRRSASRKVSISTRASLGEVRQVILRECEAINEHLEKYEAVEGTW